MEYNNEGESGARFEREADKFEFELVEAPPLLGLVASVLLLAILLYTPHA